MTLHRLFILSKSENCLNMLMVSSYQSGLNDFTGDIWRDGVQKIGEFPLLNIFCYSGFIFTESVSLSRVLLSLLIFRIDNLLL